MKFEYFILLPLMSFSAKGANESCLGTCGQIFNRSLPCQCNTVCKQHGDCCNDFDELCFNGTCVGRCGKPYDNKPQCQCNTDCKTYYNCCNDFDTFCLLGVNESTSINHINSETTFITSELNDVSTSRSTTSLSKDTDDELSTTNYISHETTFINSVNSTTRIEENNSGMIAGVVVSLTTVMLIVVIIIVFVYRRIHLRKQLKSMGNGKRTSELNYYSTENVQENQYHDIDISDGDYCLAAAISDDMGTIDKTIDADATYVRAMSGVYDKLNKKDNRKIASKLEESKIEIYTLTSNPTVNQQTKDNNSSTKWQTPDAEDFDPTYNHSNNVIVKEDLSNYDHFSNQ